MKDHRDAVVGAAWVTNHGDAPSDLDRTRLDAGQVPLLPASHVRFPEGRKELDESALEVVWFEEGDGVAILESGDPICVIPGWSDMSRGIPGYSRDVTAQSPFAFPLEDELKDFLPGSSIRGSTGRRAGRTGPGPISSSPFWVICCSASVRVATTGTT
ncbi:hypothetical protein ACFQHO_33665 [Actinomadura yumaensis]|uniref:hypothetical protein n=1 Tax=Actinomadura yumaensis TaxID=111807 RepID=UPI003608C575